MRTTWEIFNADGKLLRTCDTIEDMQQLMLEVPHGFYDLTERRFVPIPDSADVVCVEKKFRMERKRK